MDVIQLNYIKNDLINDINTTIDENFNIPINSTFKDQYLKDISDLTYSYLDFLFPIKICLNFYEYSNNRTFIENTLKKIYSNNVIDIVSDLESADIIVTNTLSPLNRRKNVYYFTDIGSKTNWSELGKRIQEKIFEKNWSV